MNTPRTSDLLRYARQAAYAPLKAPGQRKLMASRALIVGVGGLGSWTAELLARAGVGFLRLVDADKVDVTNIHRQAMYDESDAAAATHKVHAAAAHLNKINSTVRIEPVAQRLGKDNIAALAGDVELIVDGTDNFITRFIINDYAVKLGRPWLFAGVIGAEGQTMTVLPGRGPCLRCLYDAPPPTCVDATCAQHGVLGPAVSAMASIQAAEAIKILSGNTQAASTMLLKIDLWSNTVQRIDAATACRNVNCPCCKQRRFEYLDD